MTDSELTWKIHIDYVYCKLMKFTSVFYRLQHNVNSIQSKNKIFQKNIAPYLSLSLWLLFFVVLYGKMHNFYLLNVFASLYLARRRKGGKVCTPPPCKILLKPLFIIWTRLLIPCSSVWHCGLYLTCCKIPVVASEAT